MKKSKYTKNIVRSAFAMAFAVTLAMTCSFSAYAEEAAQYGDVVQVIPAQSQEVGPAFDPNLQQKIAQQGDSGEPSSQPAAGQGRPMIALTFDDGPHSDNTARLLSILEASGAKATFFVVGSRIGGREAILQRAIADGCEVGNHSYGHENLHRANHAKTVQTLTATSDLIQAACGVRPVLMRPPGGAIDETTLGTIGSLGMSAIMWSVDTKDWKTRNAQATIDHVLANAKDGDIILMHDIHATTIDACQALIPELINRGYQLVTVSELAAARGGLVPGGRYSAFRP